MSRRIALFKFSIIWFVVGVLALLLVIFLPKPSISQADYVYALELYKLGKHAEFIEKSEKILPKSTIGEVKKLIRLIIETKTTIPNSKFARQIYSAVPDNYLNDKEISMMLKYLLSEAKDLEYLTKLYERIQLKPDYWFVNLEKSSDAKVFSQVMSLVDQDESLSFSSAFSNMAQKLRTPELSYGAALLFALRGEMDRALDYYPVSSHSPFLEGRVELLVSAGKILEQELIDKIDPKIDSPRLVALKAQELIRSGKYEEAYRMFFLLVEKLPINSENLEFAESLNFLIHQEIVTLNLSTLSRQSHELLEKWKKFFEVTPPLEAFGFETSSGHEPDSESHEAEPSTKPSHDEVVSALWFDFGKTPNDLRVWKTLAWFLAHDRDIESLEKLLMRIKKPEHPYVLLFQGILAVLKKQDDAAYSYFLQAGKAGLSTAYMNAAIVAEKQGKHSEALELKLKSEEFVIFKGHAAHDKTEIKSGH